MDETAILIIQEYIDKNLFEPQISWPSSIFKERSYARWAAFEIQKNIMDELWMPPDYDLLEPMDVIFQFMVEIKHYLELSRGGPNEQLFLIAKETATEILYLFV